MRFRGSVGKLFSVQGGTLGGKGEGEGPISVRSADF